MKAIILAADGKEFLIDGNIIPKCFLPLDNSMTIIERQIRILNLNGFSSEDIIVVIGKLGSWASKNIIKRADSLSAKVVVNHQNFKEGNKDSILIAFNQIVNEDVIIIDGDLVFESNIIDRLIKDKSTNILVTKNLMNPEEIGYRIYSKNNKIYNINSTKDNNTFPWMSYTGISKISKNLVNHLKLILVKDDCSNFLDCLAILTNKFDIETVDYLDLTYGFINKNRSDQLIGGSYASLNYKLVVRKEANNDGKDKLVNEIKWLLDLPLEMKAYFPEVLNYDILSESSIWFEMPFYNGKNLREKIMIGEYDSDDTVIFIEKLLNWMFDNLYSKEVGETPINWVLSKHINRVFQRLIDSSLKSNRLAKLIDAEKIIINGKEYRNIKDVFLKIARRPDLLDKLEPEKLVMIHGDLHFQNILLDDSNVKGFLLADPRGEMYGSDIYYDLGKLWHCFNGKYDFIHTDQFKLSINWAKSDKIPNCNLEITNVLADSVYNEIHKKVKGIMPKFNFIKRDPDWEMKILFNEASHFCSVMPFHIEKAATHDRALALYLTGVKLVNDFYNKFEIEKYKELIDYYNINTLEDYKAMISNWKKDKRSNF